MAIHDAKDGLAKSLKDAAFYRADALYEFAAEIEGGSFDADSPPTSQEPVAWRIRPTSADPEEWQLRTAGAGLDFLGRSGWECQPLFAGPQTPGAA
jgi:hypothetical protein